jgi:hypothetical protein
MRALVAALLVALILPATGKAHWKPGKHNRVHAIHWAFCGKQTRHYCALGRKAVAVATCESGSALSVRAHSPWGHLGMFQFGAFARATYGFSWNPWGQAAAAYRYYRVSGWAPWECARIVGVR